MTWKVRPGLSETWRAGVKHRARDVGAPVYWGWMQGPMKLQMGYEGFGGL